MLVVYFYVFRMEIFFFWLGSLINLSILKVFSSIIEFFLFFLGEIILFNFGKFFLIVYLLLYFVELFILYLR